MKRYLFIYGSLKKGFSNENLLENTRFITNAVTKDRFLMYPNFDYTYPYLFEDKNKINESKRVKGELYLVSESYIKNSLDVFERVDAELYKRETRVLLKEDIEIEADIYITNNAILESGEVDILPSSLSEWTLEYE